MTAQPNLSLGHSIEVIHALTTAQGPIGTRELSRQIGMEHTRVTRLMGTLTQLGLAERTADRRYRPGPGIHVLAANSLRSSGLLQAALPEIRALLADGLVAALGVLWRQQVCYLFHGHPDEPLERGLAGHELYPAERSSIGIMLLALQDGADGQVVGGQPLDAVRARGWAASVAGPGQQVSIAVPVGQPAVAALAAVPQPPHGQEAVIRRLHEAAARITATLSAPPRRRGGK